MGRILLDAGEREREGAGQYSVYVATRKKNMEGFDEGTSQQSGIHPLQRIGNCYFRDKNTIYYFWNASLQQINKLRIHLFFLFLT